MFGFRSKFRPRPPAIPQDPLDGVLCFFDKNDPFRVRDACEGVQIFGGIGSGKTTTSGALLALSYLQAGLGGLVLTAKPDEVPLWLDYLKLAGREGDAIIVSPESDQEFNFMEYETTRPQRGSGLTQNIVELFLTLSSVSSHGQSGGGGENEAFWKHEIAKLLRNAIDALQLAQVKLDLPNLHYLICSGATSLKQINDPEWQEQSFCFQTMREATLRANADLLTPQEQSDYELTVEFWAKEWPLKPDNTRGSVLAIFTGMSDPLLRGVMRQLFSSGTTFTPEDTFEGKVILLDLPQKLFHHAGVIAQVLFKICWQRAIERRGQNSTPAFLWIDEAQHFITPHDTAFQATARSARACTVLISQNLPNYINSIGGKDPKSQVEALLGNLTTKIFHNNSCTATNQYAADLFAKTWQSRVSLSGKLNDSQQDYTHSTSSDLQYQVQPVDFTNLKRGGPLNDFIAEGIVHQGGRIFNGSGVNSLVVNFPQIH